MLESKQEVLKKTKEALNALENTIQQIERNHSFRLLEGAARAKAQLLGEKGALTGWLGGGESDGRYQPVHQLLEYTARLRTELSQMQLYDMTGKKKTAFLFLGVINFDYLHQRPQHLCVQLAVLGYPVFYVNVDFPLEKKEVVNQQGVAVITPACEEMQAHNIYETVDQTDKGAIVAFLRGTADRVKEICQAEEYVIINEYPGWHIGAIQLKRELGWTLIADYLDDYLDFPDAKQTQLPAMVEHMLQESDVVLATSDYLAKKAGQYAKTVEILRNGTCVEHFEKARGKKSSGTRPVVGYFGVLSDWFACDMIQALDDSTLDIDIHLIGFATQKVKERLAKCKKVRWTDVVPYEELPNYLQTFDVCLIPFDASTSLIQATNPVKFYEYLSAGKKVVATRIPELVPFENRYAYLTNDPQEFVHAVQCCLDGTDVLASEEERISFARENDWSVRVNHLLTLTEKITRENQT